MSKKVPLFYAIAVFALSAAIVGGAAPARAEKDYDEAFIRLIEKYPGVSNDMNIEVNPAATPATTDQNEDAPIALPSRFAEDDSPAVPAALDETSQMVGEWLSGTGQVGGAEVSAKTQKPAYMTNRNKKVFPFGANLLIPCRAGMIIDVELESGERITNFAMSDEKRWSISAAWSGDLENIVTHVLLRTNFPNLKASLLIYTDRRTYSMEFESSLDGLHIPYIGFNYPKAPGSGLMPIQPGRWRDLLEERGMLPDDGTLPGAVKPNRVDGAEIYSRYLIKPIPGPASRANKKIAWTPVSVYEADGRTYIVLPKPGKKDKKINPGSHSLFILNKRNVRMPVKYKIVRDDLYVVEQVFGEAVLTLERDSVSIKRLDPRDLR
jgi:hypothetical protein